MAQITARYPSTCPTCSTRIQPGQSVEWTKGLPARHVSCGESTASAPAAPVARRVSYEQVGARVYILGDTFTIRESIKSAGGHWDADRKAWWVGATKRTAIEQAVSTAVPAAPAPYRRRTCKECGGPSKGYYRCYECSLDYRDGGGMHMGGMSYYDSAGNYVLGDDD